MIELKQVFDPDTHEEYVVNQGKYYSIVQEIRGVREKFWMVMPDSDKVLFDAGMVTPERKFKKRVEPMNISHILFKSSRNDVSCENWGEVYASLIGKECDLPVVDYYMATLEKDGTKTPGVMCGSYLTTGREIEMSAYDLHQVACAVHDQDKEYVPKHGINTIEGMIEDLQSIPNQEFMPINFKIVRRELYKQAIFDFLLGQTDRHWYNTTFLFSFNPMTEKAFFIKAPCYDNGCIALLKRKASAIVGMSREIEKTGGIDSPLLKAQIDKYCPMMGVSTPLVRAEKSRKTGLEDVLVIDDPAKSREIFLDELCRVIADDAELSGFLVALTYNLNVENITSRLRVNGDEPPESIANLVKNVVGYQLRELNNHMKMTTARLRDERRLDDDE